MGVATPVELVAAGVVLVVTVVAGTVVHELSHAVALQALRVPCTVVAFPDSGKAGFLGGVTGRWATVRPTANRDRLSPWRLRVAALTPVCLLAPFVLVGAGVAPDPLATGNPPVVAATAGWVGCALPSPADFALVWTPEQALSGHDRTESERTAFPSQCGRTRRTDRKT